MHQLLLEVLVVYDIRIHAAKKSILNADFFLNIYIYVCVHIVCQSKFVVKLPIYAYNYELCGWLAFWSTKIRNAYHFIYN